MGINAAESQAYTPESGESVLGKVWNLGKATLGAGVVIAGLAVGGKMAYNYFTVPAPIAAIVEKATSGGAVATGYQNYCANGQCVQVKLCTAVSDECGSMVEGPKADYGTGTHQSADGHTRPNPPAGWKWSGK